MSSAPTDAAWRARHVHLPHSQHTAFLCDVVQPALDEHALAPHFFYLRYWQGGPHLRLRVRTGPGAADPAVATAFFDAVRRASPEPSEADRAEYEASLAAQAELARLEGEVEGVPVALGTHRDAPYEPELVKYGGPVGVAIAEDVFRATSTVALRMLGDARRRDPSSTAPPVGEALSVLALSMAGAGLGLDESEAFLERYRSWWLPYTTQANVAAWPAAFARLAPQVVALSRGVRGDDAAADPIHAAIAHATSQARIAAGARPDAPARDLLLERTPYLGCLANYVHTTNNRLGLAPAGEAMIADLLLQAIRQERAAVDDVRSSA